MHHYTRYSMVRFEFELSSRFVQYVKLGFLGMDCATQYFVLPRIQPNNWDRVSWSSANALYTSADGHCATRCSGPPWARRTGLGTTLCMQCHEPSHSSWCFVESTGTLKYRETWFIHLRRFDNHLYAPMSFPAHWLYKSAQLLKLHRQYAHASADKLYNLLKRVGTEAVTPATLKQLDEIVARCDPCQRIRNALLRFPVTMEHEDVRFDPKACIDIMYLDEWPVLLIVDEATRFSAARFLPKISTDAVWDAIVMCWSSVYTGLPHYMMVDERSQFRKLFAELSAPHGVELPKSGIQSQKVWGLDSDTTNRFATYIGSSSWTKHPCNGNWYSLWRRRQWMTTSDPEVVSPPRLFSANLLTFNHLRDPLSVVLPSRKLRKRRGGIWQNK